MTKREKIAKLARDEVNNNSLYLWGGQGESVLKTTPEKIKKMETSPANAGRVLKAVANKITIDADLKKARFFDCSGLVVDILRQLEIIAKDDDYTADGIYKKLCKPIKKDELRAGDLVFIDAGSKKTHVGIYEGDDICIEAAGRDEGVTSKMIYRQKWNSYGRVKIDEK